MMENIIWLLLLGGLFFLMHRMGFGCCGGHSHAKGHEEHPKRTNDEESIKPSTK
ncbi:MAG TPA: hypothetical protein VMW81_05760 [Nitrospinota bacterium]|nr:hypothetical protein [Nitrospinota bacterium]